MEINNFPVIPCMFALLLDQDAISKGKKRRWVIVGTVSIVGMLLLSLVLTLYVLKKNKKPKRKGKNSYFLELLIVSREEGNVLT